MPIYARRKESEFEPAPEGLHQAVCADVWEPWTEERPEEWGGGLMDKTRLVWLLEEINPKTGRPFEVAQLYTLSLHPKSKLSQHLESWRGRAFTDQERAGFDVEKLIGASCQLQVVHNLGKQGGTFANVQAVVPLGRGQTKLRIPDGYVRRKDRVNAPPNGHAPAEEDVPF